MPRLIGVSMQNRKENNINQKRAGCVSTVGRPVMITANKRCCCPKKKKPWCFSNKNVSPCLKGKKYVKISYIK